MKREDARIAVGSILVVLGILILLQNLGLLGATAALVVGIIFAAGGVVFLALFVGNPRQWWYVIPGFVLLGIGALICLDALLPGATSIAGGAIFLGSIGVAFWVIYYVGPRENWWAIIPGGVLFTLAVTSVLGQTGYGPESGAVFLMGLGVTFALVYLLVTPRERVRWAPIPAIVLFALGIVALTTVTAVAGYVWPLILILLGLFLIYRRFSPREV